MWGGRSNVGGCLYIIYIYTLHIKCYFKYAELFLSYAVSLQHSTGECWLFSNIKSRLPDNFDFECQHLYQTFQAIKTSGNPFQR